MWWNSDYYIFKFVSGNGRNDDVACFCCFINLYDWETDDDPWAEHAKANPNCIYLLLKKGKIFVVKVYEAANLLTFNNKVWIIFIIFADYKTHLLIIL